MEQTPVDIKIHFAWFEIEKSCRHLVLSTAYLERELAMDRVITSGKDYARVMSINSGMIWSALRNDVK